MAESAEGIGIQEPPLTQEQSDSIKNAEDRTLQASVTPLNPFLNTGPVENSPAQNPSANSENPGGAGGGQKKGFISKLTGIFRKHP